MRHTSALWERGGQRALPAAQLLSTYISNVLEHPTRLEYLRIRTANSAFASRVLACEGAMSVLAHCGFVETTLPRGQHLVLHQVDVALLRSVLSELTTALRTARQLDQSRASGVELCSNSERIGARGTDNGGGGSLGDGGSSSSSCSCSDGSTSGCATGAMEEPQQPVQQQLLQQQQPVLRQLQARSAILRVAAAPSASPRGSGTLTQRTHNDSDKVARPSGLSNRSIARLIWLAVLAMSALVSWLRRNTV